MFRANAPRDGGHYRRFLENKVDHPQYGELAISILRDEFPEWSKDNLLRPTLREVADKRRARRTFRRRISASLAAVAVSVCGLLGVEAKFGDNSDRNAAVVAAGPERMQVPDRGVRPVLTAKKRSECVPNSAIWQMAEDQADGTTVSAKNMTELTNITQIATISLGRIAHPDSIPANKCTMMPTSAALEPLARALDNPSSDRELAGQIRYLNDRPLGEALEQSAPLAGVLRVLRNSSY